MVETIISARQTPCNKINSKIFTEKSIDYPANTENRITLDNTNDKNTCLNFYSAQKIIHRFLNCDRVIFLPHIIPKFTEAELAKRLKVTIIQLRHLQNSSKLYKRIAKHICLPLIDLYCSTRFRQAESIQNQETHHG